MTALVSETVPRLARGVRLREDKVRGAWILLAPERVLTLNPVAVEILKLCDGRTFSDLVDDLKTRFTVERARIEEDAAALLKDLAAKRMVEL